jgi:tRNA (mo5U34)-methyltransferase
MKRLQHFFDAFYQDIANNKMSGLMKSIPHALESRFDDYTHGLLDDWLPLLDQLPSINAQQVDIKNRVNITSKNVLDDEQKETLTQLLKQFHPWRKGPFHIHGIDIDTEWRSDWKWERIKEHISPLKGRYVLDVGCGSGYHCWRMYGDDAQMVIGIDPSQLFLMQFQVLKHFIGEAPVHLLPIGIEYMPENFQQFDTVFSMGVLYHRKSPFEHLSQLKGLLRKGGELVLETLVIDGDENDVLVPGERYASMRNVWFIPSCAALTNWLEKVGFSDVKVVDVNQTSVEEQRATDWMTFLSLKDFLDPEDSNKTIEGYPAPKRATFIATR